MQSVTQSPDMKYARNRLEDLLSSMKKSASTPGKSNSDHEENENYNSWNAFGKQTRTPKGELVEPVEKVSRGAEKRILFELRQKPFELPSTTEDYSLYELCRIWLKGKSHAASKLAPAESSASAKSVRSFSVGKIIDKMPPIEISADKEAQRISIFEPPEFAEPVEVDTSSREAILASYLPRWKAIKKNINRRSNEWTETVCASNLKLIQDAFVPIAQNAQQQ